MASWLRQLLSGSSSRPKAPASPGSKAVPDLAFKSEDDFLDFARRYMTFSAPAAHATLLAQVLEARRLPEGAQFVRMNVIGDQADWEAFRLTCGKRGPDLTPGELVLWRVGRENPDAPVPQMRWIGFVFSSVHPTITPDGSWRIKHEYPFDGA